MKPTAVVGGAALAVWLTLSSSAISQWNDAINRLPDPGTIQTISEQCSCDCEEDCCHGCAGHYWFAGTEMTFLQSELTTGGNATLTIDNTDTAGTDVSLLGGSGSESFNFAPRMWVGRQISERWGVVGRFWYLNESDVVPPSSPPGFVPQQNFLTTSNTSLAELYTVDLEAIRSFSIGRTKFDGSVGARYASFKDEAELNAFGVIFPGSFGQIALSSSSQFHGTGVTGGLVGRRQLGELPLYLFLSGRGSTMSGSTFSRGRVVGTLAVPPNAPLVGAATVTRNNDDSTMDIGEFQAGLQWELELSWFPASAFLRSTFEYQRWTIHGPATGGAGFGGTLGNVQLNSFQSAGLGDATLYGYSFATGLTW